MKVYVRSRTPEIDYWWYEVNCDGRIVPFRDSVFALARHHDAIVPPRSRAIMFFRNERTIDSDDCSLGLLIINLPTEQFAQGKRITVDLCIGSDQLDEIVRVATLLVYFWPPTPETLSTLLAHCTACVAQGIAVRRSPARAGERAAGGGLNAFLMTSLPLPRATRLRPTPKSIQARSSMDRISEMLTWLNLQRGGVQAIIVASPYEHDMPQTLPDVWPPKVEYLLSDSGPDDWCALGRDRPPASAEEPADRPRGFWVWLRGLMQRWIP